MTVKTGATWAGTFVTLDATGALSAGTPSGTLYVDGVANAAEVTITGSNPYKFSVTLPTLTAGQRVDMYITATISGIATAAIVASEQADTRLLSDGVTLADDAITAAKFDESTAFPVKSADTGATQIARVGADSDTLETLSDQLDAIDDYIDTEVAAIKAKTDLITTGTTLTIASAVVGSTITAHRGDTLSAALENIGALTNYSKLWFTVKRDYDDADTAAVIQIEKTGGLLYLNGAVGTAGNGSLTINDEATGDVTIVLNASETAKLSPGNYQYDIQILRSAGTPVSTLTYGEFVVAADVTRATS
jgi:hypothetical protein